MTAALELAVARHIGEFDLNVAFTVQEALRLPRDSSAEITSDGLLGGKYISMVPGGDDKLIPVGGTVAITQSAVNVEELLGKFIFSAATLASPKTPAPDAPK